MLERYTTCERADGTFAVQFDGMTILTTSGTDDERIARWLREALAMGIGSPTLSGAQEASITALEAFEDEFAGLIENDMEMPGADTVDAVCRVWPKVKAALEAIRGEATDYTSEDDRA